MSEHYLETHRGYDHVSSDDARVTQAAFLGEGRHVIEGLEISVPNFNTVHVSPGLALIDGGWYRVMGSGVDLTIPNGSIGMNRKDRIYLAFTRNADRVEDMALTYVTGAATIGTPSAPFNDYPGDILAGDTKVYIPFADIPLSGLTVGTPVGLLTKRVLAPPASQCEQCEELNREAKALLSDCSAATTAAWEVVRAIPEDLALMRKTIEEQREWIERKQLQIERQIQQLAAMLANNIASYVLVGDTLAAPAAWVEYDEEGKAVSLAYTSYDEETGEFSIDNPLSVDGRVETNAANIDYLLMVAGEE